MLSAKGCFQIFIAIPNDDCTPQQLIHCLLIYLLFEYLPKGTFLAQILGEWLFFVPMPLFRCKQKYLRGGMKNTCSSLFANCSPSSVIAVTAIAGESESFGERTITAYVTWLRAILTCRVRQ